MAMINSGMPTSNPIHLDQGLFIRSLRFRLVLRFLYAALGTNVSDI